MLSIARSCRIPVNKKRDENKVARLMTTKVAAAAAAAASRTTSTANTENAAKM